MSGRHHPDDATSLDRFTRAAEVAANDVIESYSTSFGLATRLLGPRHRQHVRNIYAMVRVADEIVDGVAAEAGLDRAGQEATLAAYEDGAHDAMRIGYSSDLVLHAFARTARASGIGEELTRPFFDSMRTDLGSPDAAPGDLVYDAAAHERYVYGSAEVVGLMCLQVFLRESSPGDAELAVLRRGACRLGAAFQNVNFLRDLADDTDRLGRSYLGDTGRLTGETVELKPRPVEIHELTLVEHGDNGQSVFEAECGKGTYVRALARDIGRILGCFGHICALRRTLVGPFREADMIPLEELEALCNRAASGEGSLADALLPVETALDDIPALAVTRADAARLHRGQAVLLRGRDAPNSSGTVYVTVAGRLLALAEIGNGELIPKRVFNLTGLTASPGRSNERV